MEDSTAPLFGGSARERRVARELAGASAAFAAILGFILTSPTPGRLAMLNWDNGAYVADFAMGRYDYLSRPWSAHFAIGPVYAVGAWVARLWHGTVFDGLRIATAIVFAITAALVADVVLRLTRSATFTVAAMLLWTTSWVHVFLLLTIEDNLLYLPFLALLFRQSLSRSIRRRDAIVAGALAGLATLMSLQALLYVGVVSALVLLPNATLRTRALRSLYAALGFFAAIVGWCAMVTVTSGFRTRFIDLVRILTAPPNPPLAMRTLGDVRGALEALGSTAGYLVSHTGMSDAPTYGLSRAVLGALFLTLVAAVCIAAMYIAYRRGDRTLALVAGTLLAFTAITPLRMDVGYAYLKRFDFFPTCVVILVAALYRRPARAWVVPIAIAVCALQLHAGLAWTTARHATYASLPCPAPVKHTEPVWYGRDGKSWVQYFRDLRLSSPTACNHVLDLDEISEGRWWLEVPGALWSELPDHLVIGSPLAVAPWRYPPTMVGRDDPRVHARCAVLSCAAKQRIGAP